MRYKDLLLLSALWGVCVVSLEGKDVLACPFAPRDRTAAEFSHDQQTQARFQWNPISSAEIARKVPSSINWRTIHPTIRDWINQNDDRYYQWGSNNFVLYNDANYGIRVVMEPDTGGRKIFLNRTRWFDDDAAWSYQKEPAINPATRRPWIEITAAELRRINSQTRRRLSSDDEAFLKDVLSIVNENFHYFYGMEFVDLGRNPDVNKEQLVGKFIPVKCFLFGHHTDMLDLSGYTDQQVALYRELGHPIYSYDGLVDSTQEILSSSNCGGKGIAWLYLRSGFKFSVAYFNQANLDELNPSFGAVYQFGPLPQMYKRMMEGMEKLFAERGVNVHSVSANTTPLQRALYLVYQKTKKMTEAVATHEYVTTSFNKAYFEPGVRRLSDMVKIPGVRTVQSKSNASSSRKQTQIKTKVSKSKKQRKQSTERTR